MKNLIVILGVFALAGCAASRINLIAEIPESQEVVINIETKNQSSE